MSYAVRVLMPTVKALNKSLKRMLEEYHHLVLLKNLVGIVFSF